MSPLFSIAHDMLTKRELNDLQEGQPAYEYGKRKQLILKLMEDGGVWTRKAVARKLDITDCNAGHGLRRMLKQGLIEKVNSRQLDGSRFGYRLKNKE